MCRSNVSILSEAAFPWAASIMRFLALFSILASWAKATFLDRVISQIEHYKSTIQNAEIELKDLIQLRKSGEAKISDEKRIIELDHFLEQSINKQSSIPIEYKSLSNTDRLSEILNKVDELIHKVDNKDGK